MAHPRDLTSIPAADMAALEALIPGDWPAAWCEFAAMFYAGLLLACEPSITREAMARVAVEQVLTAAHQIGGRQFYLPSGVVRASRAMASRILEEFRGNNHAELAKQHGVTVMRVRQIVGAAAKAQAKARKAAQEPPKTEMKARGAASHFEGL